VFRAPFTFFSFTPHFSGNLLEGGQNNVRRITHSNGSGWVIEPQLLELRALITRIRVVTHFAPSFGALLVPLKHESVALSSEFFFAFFYQFSFAFHSEFFVASFDYLFFLQIKFQIIFFSLSTRFLDFFVNIPIDLRL
jgi:hypothetical protein